jgi:hypothetical protein
MYIVVSLGFGPSLYKRERERERERERLPKSSDQYGIQIERML